MIRQAAFLALVVASVLNAPACSSGPRPFSSPQTELAAPAEPSWLEPAFRAAVERLADAEPLTAPLELRITQLEGRWGQAWFDQARQTFVIELSPEIPGPEIDWALDVLAHEWAHCLVMRSAQEGHHDALWGVALARCYRALME